MRFLLFYGVIDALNSFTDDLCASLHRRGDETVIMDCSKKDIRADEFFQMELNGAICYDGIGMFLKDKFDLLGIPVINILVDHPMTFASIMEAAPEKYLQFSPDYNHVAFAKRYYKLKNRFFLPHMGSSSAAWERTCKKEIPVLFTGWYQPINEAYAALKESIYTNDVEKLVLFETLQCMLEIPSLTLESAMEKSIVDLKFEYTDDDIAILTRKAKPVDEFVRMYFRGKVITEVIKAGIPITLLGEGWDKFAVPGNVKRIARVKFNEVFPYMKKAEICLNVLPWFKAGSHERICNALLCNCCPLTDESSWLLKHFKQDEECAYYSLEDMEKIPEKIYELSENREKREKIIQNGREKVMAHFTPDRIVDEILQRLKQCYP